MFRYVVVAVTAVAAFLLVGSGVAWVLKGPVKKDGEEAVVAKLPEEKAVERLLREKCPKWCGVVFNKFGPHLLEAKDRQVNEFLNPNAPAKVKTSKLVRAVFTVLDKEKKVSQTNDVLFCVVGDQAYPIRADVGDFWMRNAKRFDELTIMTCRVLFFGEPSID